MCKYPWHLICIFRTPRHHPTDLPSVCAAFFSIFFCERQTHDNTPRLTPSTTPLSTLPSRRLASIYTCLEWLSFGTLPGATADFGNFVSNEDEALGLGEVVEPWYKYDIKETRHVFYPICLGEVLKERYLVEHKLGFGGGSAVWMAHDLQDKRDVALEVMSLGEWGENEIHMQDEIIQNVQDTSHFVTYLATFLFPGIENQVLS